MQKIDDDIDTPLVTKITHENLRHHMILLGKIETDIKQIIDEFSQAGKLSKYNLYPSKKILITGQTGSGKTMLTEQLAWNIGLPVLKINFMSLFLYDFSDLISMLTVIFSYCHKKPRLLLIDDCDLVSSNYENRKLLHLIFQSLENNTPNGLFVLTATKVDNKFYKYFERAITIPNLTENMDDVVRLLEMTFSAIDTDPINWVEMSLKFNDYSAASIVKISLDAMKIAILSNEKVSKKHIFMSLESNALLKNTNEKCVNN